MKQLTLALIVLALTIVTGCNDTVVPVTDSTTTPTLLDTQSITIYSHSDSTGHWFIDTSFTDDNMVYVDYGTLETVSNDKYIVTYYDTDKVELKSIDSIE